MTTTVTVKTHDWPVEVTITDRDDPSGRCRRKRTVTVEEVEPNSEQDFHLTDTRSICFAELDAPVTAESHPIPPGDQS